MSNNNPSKDGATGGAKKEVLEPGARMKNLVEMSHDVTVDKNISIARYFNSGRELIKAASGLEAKGENEKAFVLYLRYTTLFIEKLVRHPEWSKADKDEKKLVRDECNHVLDCADNLKKLIMNKFNAEFEEYMKTKGTSGETRDSSIQKRSVEPQGSAHQSDYSVDDIDKKFDFSKTPTADSSEKIFDPFNIEHLKQSFNTTSDK